MSSPEQREKLPFQLRIAIIVFTGILGVYIAGVVGFSAGYSPRARSLATIGLLANPWSLGDEAFKLIGSNKLENVENGRRLAQQALRQDPTVIPAISALALSADIRGDTKTAHKLFEKSLALSRRDLTTHLWFIEFYAFRQDARSTLRHYDESLRTSAAANQILMPVLLNAAFDQSLAPEIADRLTKRPAWAPVFLSKMASTPGSTAGVVYLFSLLQQAGYPINSADQNTVIDRAVNDGMFKQAYYLSGRKDNSFGLINSTFDKVPSHLPFDWTLFSSPDFGAELIRIGGLVKNQFPTHVLRLYSTPSSGGETAKQLVMLNPGDYFLKMKTIDATSYSGSPYVTVTCASSNGKELGRLDFGRKDQFPKTLVTRFQVLPLNDCRAQWLRIFMRPSRIVDAKPVLVSSVFIGHAQPR